MGVYIKGMEMPTEEEISKCIIVRHDGEVWAVDYVQKHYPELFKLFFNSLVACYPTNLMRAIFVPPHGRLIEESKVLDIVSEWCPDDDGSVGKVGDLREMLDEIEALPTIIPAEEGECE